MSKPHTALALLLAALLAGCSWWDTEVEVEPAALSDFEPERAVKTLWTVTVGDGLGEKYHQFQPAILGNRIYVVDREGTLLALNRDTGERIWQRELALPVSGGVGVGDGKLAVTTYEGEVHVLRALDGSPLWQAKLPSESVVPVQLSPELALVQTIDGRLTAFDPATGERQWTYSAQIPSLTLRGTSTPLLMPGITFAGFANGKLVALDNDSGELIWETRVAVPQGKTELERIIDVDGRLMLDDGLLYVTSYQGRVAVVSARDGRQLWGRELSSHQGAALSATQLFVTDEQGYLHAMARRGGAPIWKQDGLYFRQVSAPTLVAGAIAVADFEGYVHFLSPLDGRFLVRTRVDGSGVRGPLVAEDDRLYVLGNSGRLAALTLSE